MLKDKITYLFKARNRSIDDYARHIGSTKQSVYTKLRNESLTVRDLAKICDFLSIDLTLESASEKFSITLNDFSSRVERRGNNGQNLGILKVEKSKVEKSKVEKVAVPQTHIDLDELLKQVE